MIKRMDSLVVFIHDDTMIMAMPDEKIRVVPVKDNKRHAAILMKCEDSDKDALIEAVGLSLSNDLEKNITVSYINQFVKS